jgi:DNA-binding CsgD family transcriptional regulator
MEAVEYDKAKETWRRIAKYSFHVGDFYYFIVNCPNAQVEWTSNPVTRVLGLAKAEDFTLEFALANIHPEDLPYFLEFEKMVASFFNELPAEKVTKYKVSYDYRIRRTDGAYIRMLQQAVAIQANEEGAVLKMLNVHTDITHLKKENNTTLSFIGLEGESSIRDYAQSKDFATAKYKLTNKETEILHLLAAGKTSYEVADTLFISKHTVDTHRKNMLKRTKSRSMVELTMMCMKDGTILI